MAPFIVVRRLPRSVPATLHPFCDVLEGGSKPGLFAVSGTVDALSARSHHCSSSPAVANSSAESVAALWQP